MKKYIFAAALSAAAVSVGAQTPLWLRNPQISPQGDRIAFTYKGDIYTIPTEGGMATRLTSQPTYETRPIWSPDGRTIAFASDRNGNMDIFTINADGSSTDWNRLTFNSANETPEAFTPDGAKVLFSASIQDPATSAQFPSGRLTEVYAVPVRGGAPVQFLATPARNIAWAPDGRSLLYEDVKGFEDPLRKHHTSSVTRDIWRYTPATGSHERLVDLPGEDLSPVQDASSIYFLSERAPQTSLNVYKADLANPGAATAVTNFRNHPVRSLSRAGNGTLAFSYDGELYTLDPAAGNPRKVAVSINADYPDDPETLVSTRGARRAVASPNGKNVAFLYRGDVFVTSVEHSTTKQISNTAAAESDLAWANDSTLVYTSERNGRYEIFTATPRRGSADGDIVHATIIDEKPVFGDRDHERTVPQMSPDGKYLAFIQDRTDLAVRDMATGRVRILTHSNYNPGRDGRFYYRWSPDSKWIALEIVDRHHDPYTDVAIINVATGELTNITNSGYFDAEPRWALDGNALTFASERFGMRNHASWGSQMDVMIVFMNQAALDHFNKSEEQLQVEGLETKLERDGDIVVETQGIEQRQLRLTPFSTDLRDAILSADGETLYYITEADDGSFIWELEIKDEDLSMKRRIGDDSATFDASADGKKLFLFGSQLQKFGNSLTPISYRATKRLDAAAEREYMFDFMAREEQERFYVADMHGVDWPALTAHYRTFLPHINNNYDFAELLSEILGELNVSHTGARFRSTSDTKVDDRTASLALLYDMEYSGNGAKIVEILPQSPLRAADPELRPGDIVTHINGNPITPYSPLANLMNELSGKRTLITVQPASGDAREVVAYPVSRGRENQMLYERWVRNREHTVDSLSGGRLGYVHLESMDDESFRTAYSALLGKFNDREGVVVDIRWNGGGRLHEDIEVLLSGQKYFQQEIRGQRTCDMPSRRWNKPSIMLMSEACYSNAHGTPWVYSHQGIGKTIGMPVPGTMTSVNWVTLQDPTVYFGIPVVGYRLADGSFLENQQLDPDIRVENSPTLLVGGTDSQLNEAVRVLLQQIDSQN